VSKRFFWLKLKTNFFNQPRLKKLRRMQDGDRLLLIYIKILLLSVPTDGKVIFEGLEDSLAEELALALDEDPSDVRTVLDFLGKFDLIEEVAENEYVLPEAVNSIGSETDSAERMRKLRSKQASQCDSDVQTCDTDIDIEPEIEQIRGDQDCTLCPPAWVDVHEFFFEKKIVSFSAEEFIEFNEARNWKIDGDPIRDWKALAVAWNKKKLAEIEKEVLGNGQF